MPTRITCVRGVLEHENDEVRALFETGFNSRVEGGKFELNHDVLPDTASSKGSCSCIVAHRPREES